METNGTSFPVYIVRNFSYRVPSLFRSCHVARFLLSIAPEERRRSPNLVVANYKGNIVEVLTVMPRMLMSREHRVHAVPVGQR